MNSTQDAGGEEQAPPPEAPANVPTHPSPRQSSSAHDANGISLHEVAPVNLAVHHVSVTIGENADSKSAFLGAFGKGKARDDMEQWIELSQPKSILSDISAYMPSGTITAIIGSSGSGKTSLLNVLSGRLHGKTLKRSGIITFNGSEDLVNARHAYVIQQDCLIPTLTVRETLQFSADLRLPEALSQADRSRIVEEVVLELGLKECASTRIGDERNKGCSGGEKRRTSIGVQLLANPSVVFADEPSTGLDATSAYHVVNTLKNLARRGRTVIVTIHQPRSEIWELFDRVILLTHGSCAYSGVTSECIPYFTTLGYQLPNFVNPAEFFIDLLAVDARSEELESASFDRVNKIKAAWKLHHTTDMAQRPATSSDVSIFKATEKHPKVSTWRQVKVLTARTIVVTARDPLGLIGSLIEAILMGIVAGWIFYKLDKSLAGIRSRQSAFYVATSLQGYLILMYETYRLTVDIEIFDRERGEGVVGVAAFLISRRIAKLIEDIPVPFIFSSIFYFMAGFQVDGAQFLTFFSVILIVHYVTIALATLCVSLVRDFATASLISNLSYTFQTYAGGFFIQIHNLPIYLRWTKWAAYSFYAFGALCANEFTAHFYDCPESGGPNNPICRQYDGNFQLQALGIPINWIWRPIVILLAFFVGFYSLAALVLCLFHHQVKISKSSQKDASSHERNQKVMKKTAREVQTVTISLEEYTLHIEKRKYLGAKRQELVILKPLTTTFEPGGLNVIMGPSGSGKSSLLSSLAHRLKSSSATKYRVSGKMLINEAEIAKNVVQSIISFVTQEDDALLPSLTVRETLQFAASLRLPSCMSKEDKNRRAEEVLLKMGLKHCSNNLIGNDLVKGISGGEKRRVTIAVQLLTDPRVLLLDEPTSGLDGFTAQSIIDLLQTLAEEGRTVILAIHQSRSDQWPMFQNVLLLARGGYPVYTGPGQNMLGYFASVGFGCPEKANPADFALDLITIDLRHAEREAATREKVQRLIESWNKTSSNHPVSATIGSPAELGSLLKSTSSFRIAFPVLIRRSVINFCRERNAAIARIMQVVGYGIVLALFFSPLKNDYNSIQTRLGYAYNISGLYFVGMLQNVAVYPSEKSVFYREHDDSAYGVEAFFMAYTALELPSEILSALIFSVFGAVAIGLPRTAEVFFVVAYNCFCVVSCGESVGILFNTVFSHTGFAINVTSIVLSIGSIMSGVMSINMPAVLHAFNYLNPVKYSIANLAVYTFRGLRFTCDAAQRLPDGTCPQETGEAVLKLYKLDKSVEVNLMALGVVTVSYRLIAYLILKIKRERWLLRP